MMNNILHKVGRLCAAGEPVIYKPRHLYKLSTYINEIYGDIM